MKSKKTILSVEIENLHRTENEMLKVYSELYEKVNDPTIKKKIKHIRDQEFAHINLVTELIAILHDYIHHE